MMMEIVVKRCRNFILIIALLLSNNLIAKNNYLILGVIASTHSGVALIKNMSSKKVFALKEGKSFDKDLVLKKVNRKNVEIIIKGKIYILKVGDDTNTAFNDQYIHKSYFSTDYGEIEVDNNTIKISKDYKDYLINKQLSSILMQAAAIPYSLNGELKGFQLWELDPKSIFKTVGLNNGDVITKINGTSLTDAAMAIRTLNALKNADKININYLRAGETKNMEIIVQ